MSERGGVPVFRNLHGVLRSLRGPGFVETFGLRFSVLLTPLVLAIGLALRWPASLLILAIAWTPPTCMVFGVIVEAVLSDLIDQDGYRGRVERDDGRH
jgi:hypothetical protein